MKNPRFTYRWLIILLCLGDMACSTKAQEMKVSEKAVADQVE